MEHRYPDPDRVPYARLHPVGNACQLTSQASGKMYPMHNHGAWIDESGEGNTDVDAGHFHRVKDFRVLPDLSDGHTHDLTGLPCGAGAPNLPVAAPNQRMMIRGANGEIMMMGPPPDTGLPWGWIIGGVVVAAAVAAGLYFFLREPGED